MEQPLISVIMPVYNAERYLKEAIDSILQQTYTNFELIAIDDGSTDNSRKILGQYADLDSRMRVLLHKQNKRIVATLNEGLKVAKGEYIARMDADDVSFLDRFELQVAMLEKHKDVVLVAGGFEVIDESSEFLYREVVPAEDEDIKRAMLLRNPIAHGSVMFRKSLIDEFGVYSNEFGPTEDFELWCRFREGGQFRALESAVYRWRVNRQGITSNNSAAAAHNMRKHTDKLWRSHFPAIIAGGDLRSKGQQYYRTYRKRGVDMKTIILNDNAQLAVKMIARGRPLSGVRQMIAVAAIGRSGIRAASSRTRIVLRGLLRKSWHVVMPTNEKAR